MPRVDAGPGVAPKEAIDYFRAKGFKVGFDHRDVWGQEHAHAFTVAKAMNIDILEAIRGGVDEALASGMTYREFGQQLTPLLQRLGWWGQSIETDPVTGETGVVQLGSPRRLKTIYDTNLRTARAAGQWERIQRTKRTHPYLLYELGPSENHRPEHASWAGILLPVDDPWWQTHYPQNGWGCKCRVRQVSKREYERLTATGHYLTEAPPIEYREWTNKRTGETLKVPKGIDPGWDINPGIGRQARAEQQLNTKEAAFKAAIAAPVAAAKPGMLPAGSLFTTAPGVNQASLERVLHEIPGAEKQVATLSRFMKAHPIKAIFIKQAEMGTGKTAHALAPQVKEFLGYDSTQRALWAYTHRMAPRCNGFTAQPFEHVVVKCKSGDNLAKIEPSDLAKAAEQAIDSANSGKQRWSLRATLDAITEGNRPGSPMTWLHELGHQVHYYAGRPTPPPGARSITKYGGTNSLEWHAEHFAAWVVNRTALEKWSPEVAKHFDNLLEHATIKGRKG